MMLTNVLFLSMTLNWLPIGGMMSLSAWGRTIRRMSSVGGMPEGARCLSLAPVSTPAIPARMISAM